MPVTKVLSVPVRARVFVCVCVSDLALVRECDMEGGWTRDLTGRKHRVCLRVCRGRGSRRPHCNRCVGLAA